MLAVVFPQRCHVFPQRFSLRILGISSCVYCSGEDGITITKEIILLEQPLVTFARDDYLGAVSNNFIYLSGVSRDSTGEHQ